MRGQDLRQLYESCGNNEETRQKVFSEKIKSLLDENKISVEDFSLRELFEAVDSTTFGLTTGTLIHKALIDSYNGADIISDQLVTNIPSNRQEEIIVGFTATESPKLVPEGLEYEESSIGDKGVGTRADKYGRIISITEEAVMFDQTGQILNSAREIGEKAAQYKEKLIIDGIVDLNTNVYRPVINGVPTATALYSSGNGNLVTSNPLSDYTSIESARKKFADFTDENGDPISIRPKVILVPFALETTARRILNSIEIEEITGESGSRATHSPNPFRDSYKILSSVFVDGVSTTTWFFGDFKRQFGWQDVIPLQVTRRKSGNEDEFKRDVVAQFKVRFFGGVFAKDKVYVIKNTA